MNYEKIAAKGRGGDTRLAHVMKGETMVPPGVMSPELKAELYAQMQQAGIDPKSHVVGSGMSINPETGLPEFGFFKKIFKFASSVAPIALPFVFPGVGTALGTALGATGASAGALGSGLLGAGSGLLTGGGVKGALTGGALGALGGYAGSGGLSGTTLGGLLGSGSDSVTLPGIGSTSLENGSGLLGGISKAGSTLGGLLNGNSGGGLSSYALPALGAASSLYSNQQAQEQLKKATNQANAALSPYNSLGAGASNKLSDFLGIGGNGATTEDILAASPGYKFQLDQGLQALDRQNAARGGLFSGQALKATQDYTANLANQTANDYYSKLANATGTGLSAASQYGNNTTALGSAGANANIQTGNTLSQLLAGIGRKITGYDTNGKPIYA